jgi:hypothetical protein
MEEEHKNRKIKALKRRVWVSKQRDCNSALYRQYDEGIRWGNSPNADNIASCRRGQLDAVGVN